jgi:hypothetical protein
MGFHKRWVNKENLIIRYKYGGISDVKRYLDVDALILRDEFSCDILELLNDKNDESAVALFDSEIINYKDLD